MKITAILLLLLIFSVSIGCTQMVCLITIITGIVSCTAYILVKTVKGMVSLGTK